MRIAGEWARRLGSRHAPLLFALAVSAVSALYGGCVGTFGYDDPETPSDPGTSFGVAAASTGILTFVVLAHALAARRSVAAVLRAFLGSSVAGALNGVIVWTLGGLAAGVEVTGRSLEDLALLAVAALFVALIGTVVGCVFSLAVTPIALGVWTLESRRARSARWWLAWLGGAAVAIGAAPMIRAPAGLHAAGAFATALATLALVVSATGALVLAQRAWWLRRVRRGRVPGYAIVARDDAQVSGPLPRWGPLSETDEVLVRERVAGDGAYRNGVVVTAIAYAGRAHLGG